MTIEHFIFFIYMYVALCWFFIYVLWAINVLYTDDYGEEQKVPISSQLWTVLIQTGRGFGICPLQNNGQYVSFYFILV